jgi:hypothetical protein
MVINQLLRPIFGYLAIQHPTKRFVDWILPTILGVVATLIIYLFDGSINFFGTGGIVSLVLGYVQNLPGFYIAALAAIATFARPDIDVLMPGDPPPRIRSEDNRGVVNLIELTRRRFLSLLFAFLTIECIFLTFISIGMVAVAPAIGPFFTDFPRAAVYFISLFIYFTVLFQLLIATLWGLYYLGERIHQS